MQDIVSESVQFTPINAAETHQQFISVDISLEESKGAEMLFLPLQRLVLVLKKETRNLSCWLCDKRVCVEIFEKGFQCFASQYQAFKGSSSTQMLSARNRQKIIVEHTYLKILNTALIYASDSLKTLQMLSLQLMRCYSSLKKRELICELR